MGEKKNLSIDAVDCDLRGVSEETLKQYGEISINAVAVYVTERTQELLARYHVKIDANTVEKLEEDEKIVTHNGVYRLTGTEGGAEKVHLQVNGKLYVEKSAEEALKNYKSIQVNGKVVCPESLGSALSGILTCNGVVSAYPDGWILVEKPLTADRVFAARAKQGARYLCSKEVRMLGSEADILRLAEKEVKLRAPKAFVAESLLEHAVEVLEENVDIILVPDGCMCIEGDTCVDGRLTGRCGKKLLIAGDAEIKDGGVLEELEFLYVDGDVFVSEKDEGTFQRECQKSGDMVVYKGKLVSGETALLVDRELLDETGILTAAGCAQVRVSEELTQEDVRGRLFLENCADVVCSEAVSGIVRLQSRNVSSLRNFKNDEVCEQEKDEGTVYVNAVTYVM